MKINSNYVLQTIADEHIVVPVGKAAGRLHGIMKLNETGVFLWLLLSQSEKTRDELISATCTEYRVDSNVATADIDTFLLRLQAMGALINE